MRRDHRGNPSTRNMWKLVIDHAVYTTWCEDNALHALAQKAFSSFLKNNEKTYNLEYSNKVTNREGKQVRGFMGIELIRSPLLM